MRRATNGRMIALIMAAGLMLCLSAPTRANDVQANDTDTRATEQQAEAEPGKPIALNKFSRRKRSAKVARQHKPRVIARGYRRKAIEADAAPNAVPMAEPEQTAISENVANANAQWPAPDSAAQAGATPPPARALDVTTADQLNDLDRGLPAAPNGEDTASQIATQLVSQVAQNPAQAAGVNMPTTATPAISATASSDQRQVASNADSAWGQSSLIGKMFIAFGGLLTVASAARMFMA
ncbi:MAG: hypothetical protein JWQ51_1531 [Tardiphaga sp.]|nr:hypothetical protein [Tardiphaga sp.]